jgi:hypothetical protein
MEAELFRHGAAQWLPLIDNIVTELHGDEASEVFFGAIDKRRFDSSRCGELTACLCPTGHR